MDFNETNNEIYKDLNPNDLFTMGHNLGGLGKFEEAIQCYDAYLSINPWDTNAINNKADCLMGLKKYDEAKRLELYALTLDPKYAWGWCTLGEILSLTQELFCARLNIELAEQLSNNDVKLDPILKQHFKDMDEGKALRTNFYY